MVFIVTYTRPVKVLLFISRGQMNHNTALTRNYLSKLFFLSLSHQLEAQAPCHQIIFATVEDGHYSHYSHHGHREEVKSKISSESLPQTQTNHSLVAITRQSKPVILRI